MMDIWKRSEVHDAVGEVQAAGDVPREFPEFVL